MLATWTPRKPPRLHRTACVEVPRRLWAAECGGVLAQSGIARHSVVSNRTGPDIERIFRTRGCSEILSANEAPQGRSYERTDFCSFDSYRMRGHSESIISE